MVASNQVSLNLHTLGTLAGEDSLHIKYCSFHLLSVTLFIAVVRDACQDPPSHFFVFEHFCSWCAPCLTHNKQWLVSLLWAAVCGCLYRTLPCSFCCMLLQDTFLLMLTAHMLS